MNNTLLLFLIIFTTITTTTTSTTIAVILPTTKCQQDFEYDFNNPVIIAPLLPPCALSLTITGCNKPSPYSCQQLPHHLTPLRQVTYLRIHNNSALTNLTLISHIQHVNTIIIESNHALVSLKGLNLHQSKINQILIANNALLPSLVGLFDQLTEVTDYLEIYSNSALTSLTGLEGIKRIKRITIHDNNALLSLNGLNDVVYVHTLEIQYNNLLRWA
jgi:hypothetical protein